MTLLQRFRKLTSAAVAIGFAMLIFSCGEDSPAKPKNFFSKDGAKARLGQAIIYLSDELTDHGSAGLYYDHQLLLPDTAFYVGTLQNKNFLFGKGKIIMMKLATSGKTLEEGTYNQPVFKDEAASFQFADLRFLENWNWFTNYGGVWNSFRNTQAKISKNGKTYKITLEGEVEEFHPGDGGGGFFTTYHPFTATYEGTLLELEN
jgi:hypothetical protein